VRLYYTPANTSRVGRPTLFTQSKPTCLSACLPARPPAHLVAHAALTQTTLLTQKRIIHSANNAMAMGPRTVRVSVRKFAFFDGLSCCSPKTPSWILGASSKGGTGGRTGRQAGRHASREGKGEGKAVQGRAADRRAGRKGRARRPLA
jgi:hypothetical protein